MTLVRFNGLNKALIQFEENGKLGESGKWKIVNGGYDLWFEIYYDGYTVLQCIAGELSGGFRPFLEFNETIENNLIGRVIAQYPDLKRKED